ncbi:MAG: FAD-binding oxidoreductase [Croceibacterium sp.]
MPTPTPTNLATLRPADPAFGKSLAGATWNARLAGARAPAGIVAVRTATDAAAAIRKAASEDLKISPRGSGHHYEAAALRDGGLMLDLGGLDFIEVNAKAQTARVGAGVKGGHLAKCLAARGLAFPVGHCADVALSGYILAGGFGWNAGEWGPACANVRAIEMVTAAGDIVVASESEHADLFWAARGGGPGFFAAITAYHLTLHPLPGAAFALSHTFTAASAPALANWLTAATATAHPSAEIVCLVGIDPESRQPTVTVRAIAVGADEAGARSRVASFLSPPAEAEPLGEPQEESLDFTELGKFSAMPSGKRVAADHVWSDAPLGDLLLAVYTLAEAPSPLSTINLVSLGGDGAVPSRPHGVHGALSVGGGAGAGIYAMWDDAADDAANCAWVRQVDAALAPLRSGRYVGEADLTAGPERLGECFTPEALGRLGALRQQYDPHGRFFTWP